MKHSNFLYTSQVVKTSELPAVVNKNDTLYFIVVQTIHICSFSILIVITVCTVGKKIKTSIEITDRNKLRRRSLFVSANVKKGDRITPENIKSVRPAEGIHPKYYTTVLKKKFTQDVKKGTPLSFDFIL